MTWPSGLHHFLRSHGVSSYPGEPLHGLSHNQVWRVVGPTTSLIVKAAPTPKEIQFYQAIAPLLNAQGIATPELLWADTRSHIAWCVLEDIPTPLPHTRWQADQDVLTLLNRLHRATIPSTRLALFVPAWTDTLTQTASTLLPVAQRPAVQRMLDTVQAHSQHLFQSQCWISGDPNPLNWGVRRDGTVVLYDWERFGRGTPALDLAITVPGLGHWRLFEQVARQYLHAQAMEEPDDATLIALTRDIAYAKVWNVVEYLALVRSGQVKQTEGVPELVRRLREWLAALIV